MEQLLLFVCWFWLSNVSETLLQSMSFSCGIFILFKDKILPFANKDSLIFPFLSVALFFSGLISVVKILDTILNRNSKRGSLASIPDFRQKSKASHFQFTPLIMWSTGLSWQPLLCCAEMCSV